MRIYSVFLLDGTEREYQAKTINSAINKGLKLGRQADELVVSIIDVTDIEINEECPIVWEM